MTECCPAMQREIDRRCAQHPDRFDCPDAVVYRTVRGSYGLIIHDGGASWYDIAFCPWCGARIGDPVHAD
jgi:hypothetical protein